MTLRGTQSHKLNYLHKGSPSLQTVTRLYRGMWWPGGGGITARPIIISFFTIDCMIFNRLHTKEEAYNSTVIPQECFLSEPILVIYLFEI